MHATPYLTRQVFLTLLSPVHVGCGETYDPTNYVIDEGVLYGFEPSLVWLPEQERQELRRLALKGDRTGWAAFFHRNRRSFTAQARTAVRAGREVCLNYQKLVERKGSDNQCLIERTTYTAAGDDDTAFIPGSSVKGAVHTALLERLHIGKRDVCKDDELWGKGFEKRPLRLLKVGDFMPEGPVLMRAVSAKRLAKDARGTSGRKEGIPMAIETLWPGGYRAFSSSWAIEGDRSEQGIADAYVDFQRIARDLTAFNRSKLEAELRLLEVDPKAGDWGRRVRELLGSIDPLLKRGDMALLRVGKFQGALSLRLSASDKKPPKTQTFVLNDGQVLPFGWALLEFRDEASEPLKAWCRAWPDTQAVDLRALRQARREEETRRREEARAEDERRKAVEVAEAAEEARLAAMSDEKRRVVVLGNSLGKYSGTVNPGSDLFRAVQVLLREAATWANIEDRKLCALTLAPLVKERGMYQGKAKKELKELLNKLGSD